MLSEKQVHEESLENEDIENCIEEHSNNITEISDALPILSEMQIDKESLKIEDIENCIEKNSSDAFGNPDSLPILSEEQVHDKPLQIGDTENCIEEDPNNKSKISNTSLEKPCERRDISKNSEITRRRKSRIYGTFD